MSMPSTGQHPNLPPKTDETSGLVSRFSAALGPRGTLGTLVRDQSFIVGAIMFSTILAAALLGPILLPFDLAAQDLRQRLLPPVWSAEGQWPHVLGTDALGRDYLTRLLYGARTSFQVSGLAVVLSLCFGAAVGLVAGYFGKAIDAVLMRLTDIQLAFPFVILCIALLSALRPTPLLVSVVLAIADWVIYARMARGNTLMERDKEYILAARSLGAPAPRIVFRHVLPNVLPVLVVIAALEFATLVQVEALLSFLGMGVQPPTPSWGNMLGEGRTYLITHPWVITLPGLFLFYTILGVNLMADGLRNVLDPASRR